MNGENLDRMSRRRFVKFASALGIPAASLSLGTKEGLAKAMDRPSDEISYVSRMHVQRDEDGKPTGRDPVYETIPRDAWNDMEATYNAGERVRKQLSQEVEDMRLYSVSVISDDQSPTGASIKVYVETHHTPGDKIVSAKKSPSEVQSILPKTAEGAVGDGDWRATRRNIPIAVEEQRTKSLTGTTAGDDLEYEHTWLDKPGACVFQAQTDDGTSVKSTMTMTFYNDNYNSSSDYYLTCAGHTAAKEGADWGNPSIDSVDGDVVESYTNEFGNGPKDYALLDIDYNRYETAVRNTSSSDPNTDWPVGGAITNQELKNENYGDYNKISGIKVQGCRTGRKGGLNVTDWFPGPDEERDDDRVGIGPSYDASFGDSGGPMFFIEEIGGVEQLVMCGLLQKSLGTGGVMGPTAEAIEVGLSGFFA